MITVAGIPVSVYLVALWRLHGGEALPARGCPKYDATFYVPDKINQCIYYRCLKGHFVGGPRSCPPGKGVSILHSSDSYPCKLKRVTSCIRQPNFAGSFSGGITNPPPTKVGFIYRVPAIQSPVTTDSGTSVSDTTELIGMTTEEEIEMTTPASVDMTPSGGDTTDDMGSGEDDDAVSGKPGVFFDKAGVGGLPVKADTQDDCLTFCTRLSGLCWGMDWDGEAKECRLYLTLPGSDMCGRFEDKPKNVHIRFKC